MTDISQSYNIDTTQAIAALAALDKSINRLNRSIGNLDGTTKSVQSLTVSWQTLGRVVATQAIVRGVTQVTQAFREAADTASQFQIAVARIQGIADVDNVGGLVTSLEQIAVSAGRNINEVGRAALDAFQNDLGTTAETTELLTKTVRDLAVATESDFGDAVNTISPLIKAYNLDAEAAAKSSAILFQTVDSGVVQLDQLEGKLGTVAKLAADLEVPVEELFAAIATGTLAGNDTSTSLTQLRNVLIKLIKPTEEMRVAFNKLGVQTFKELQATGLNLRESIQAIFDALDQDPERFAKAFNTIRATLGATNIRLQEGSNNAAVFDRILKDMEGSVDGLANALDLIEATDAFKDQQNAARYAVILNELGNSILQVKVFFGDLALAFINDTPKITTVLLGATGAATAFGLAMAGVPFAALAIVPAAAAATSAFATLWAIDGIEAYRDSLGKIRNDLNAIGGAAAALEVVRADEVQKAKDLDASLNDVGRAINVVVANSDRAVSDLTARLRDETQSLGDFALQATESFADGRVRLISDIENTINQFDRTIARNLTDVNEARRELEDFDFQRGLKGLSETQRLLALQQRAYDKIREARQAAANVSLSDESRQEAEAANRVADAAVRSFSASAERLGNQRAILVATSLERGVLETNLQIVNRQKQALEGTNVNELRKGLVSVTNLNAEQLKQVEEIRKLYSTTDADGAQKSVTALSSDIKEARERTKELASSFEDLLGKDIIETLGFADSVERANQALLDGLSEVDIDLTGSIDRFQAELQSRTFRVNVELQALIGDSVSGSPELQAALDRGVAAGGGDLLETTKGIREEFQAIIKDQGALQAAVRESQSEARLALATIVQAGKQLDEQSAFDIFQRFTQGSADFDFIRPFVDDFKDLSVQITQLDQQGLVNIRSEVGALAAEIRDSFKEGDFGEERFQQLQSGYVAALDLIDARLKGLGAQELLSDPLVEGAQRALEAAQQLEQTDITPTVNEDTVRRLRDFLERAGANASTTSTNVRDIGTSASNSNSSVNSLSSTTGGLSGRANAAAQAFRNMEQAARAAAAAAASASNSSPGGQFARNGGQITYRAGGGGTRGQDTVPAMLSPGEFVVNAQQSKNFFSQLQAINAGAGSGGTGGGSTTINIGDVNVTTPSGVPNDVARDVGQSIKRELRRRTFKL